MGKKLLKGFKFLPDGSIILMLLLIMQFMLASYAYSKAGGEMAGLLSIWGSCVATCLGITCFHYFLAKKKDTRSRIFLYLKDLPATDVIGAFIMLFSVQYMLQVIFTFHLAESFFFLFFTAFYLAMLALISMLRLVWYICVQTRRILQGKRLYKRRKRTDIADAFRQSLKLNMIYYFGIKGQNKWIRRINSGVYILFLVHTTVTLIFSNYTQISSGEFVSNYSGVYANYAMPMMHLQEDYFIFIREGGNVKGFKLSKSQAEKCDWGKVSSVTIEHPIISYADKDRNVILDCI